MTDSPAAAPAESRPEPWVIETREGGVAVLTLNNPGQMNALAFELMTALQDAFRRAEADPQVRAILITGAGRGFCAGAQFGGPTFGQGAAIGERIRTGINPLIAAMNASAKPVVTAVNGPAAGAGVGLALAGDITVAGRSALFLLSFARLGAALDGGTSWAVQRAVGSARARGLALLAHRLDGQAAADWGLIWKCVEDAALMDEAMAIARQLADGPPVSLGLIKGQIEGARVSSLAEALEAEAEAQAAAFVTEDLREGAAAFVEKRAPVFRGR